MLKEKRDAFIKVSGGDNPSYEPTTFKGITITGAVGQQTTTYSGTASIAHVQKYLWKMSYSTATPRGVAAL